MAAPPPIYQEIIWAGVLLIAGKGGGLAEKRKLRGVNHCKPLRRVEGGNLLFITLPTAIAILSVDHKTNLYPSNQQGAYVTLLGNFNS